MRPIALWRQQSRTGLPYPRRRLRSFQSVIRVFISALCALASLTGSFSPVVAASPYSVELPGHVLANLAKSKNLGPMPLQQTLRLTIVLQPSGTVEIPAAASLKTLANPITFSRAVGRSQSDIDMLSTYFTRYGLLTFAPPSDHLHLSIEGTVDQIQRAFGITLSDFQDSQGRQFYATAVNPNLPSNLAPMVQAVIGLHGASRLQPMHTAPRPIVGPTTTTPFSRVASTTGDFTPANMQSAYGLSALYKNGSNGGGQTIGIIGCDAFSLSDIRGFESQFGLPQVPVSTVNVDGGGSGTDIETALDLEWSNAIALHAALIYYSFPVDSSGGCSNAGFYDALMTAVNQNIANVLSISLGECENDLGQAERAAFEGAFTQAAANQQSVFVASGDSGAYACQDQSGNSVLGVSYPGSSAYVTAVGGTTLSLNSDGSYAGESAWGSWSECQGGCGSGGGDSQVISEPDWQRSVSQINATGMRGVPDVAYNADPATGNLVYWNGAWYEVGGTSIATPQWAGIAAIADQLAGDRLGLFSPYLYASQVTGAEGSSKSPYHDIASGGNLYYTANPGWDYATGWGSPRVSNLLALIAAPPTPTPTATPTETPTPTATETPVPLLFPVTAGSPATIETTIESVRLKVSVPANAASPPIARIGVAAPSGPTLITPSAIFDELVPNAVLITAYDASGNSIEYLNNPMTISFTFYPWNDVDPSQAQIYTTLTVNQSAFTQQLITQSTANPDGSYTASAQTSHLSPFGVYVPIDVTLTPKAYFPLTANNSPGPGW